MNFQTFLTKFSFVNPQFINDFNIIFKEEYIDKSHDFLIDSEDLRNWLDINQCEEFNNTIKRNYRLNIDYKIKTMKKSTTSGAHNFQIITLTPETA